LKSRGISVSMNVEKLCSDNPFLKRIKDEG